MSIRDLKNNLFSFRSGLFTFMIFIILANPLTAKAALEIAVTVDDLPRHGDLPRGTTRLNITREMLDVFDRHHLRGIYGFINGKKIDDQEDGLAVLKEWIQRGQYLGNHTFSHIDLNQVTTKEYESDIEKNESALKSLFINGDYHWFPFLYEGTTLSTRATIREYLKDRGYKIAQVSITFGDWNWQDPYVRCLDKKDDESVKKLKSTYLENALASLYYNRALSQQLFNRDIKYVLLIHIGAFTTKMLDDLLTSYEKAGVRFVPLENAYRDLAYRLDPKYIGEWTGPFLDQIRISRGLPKPNIPTATRPDFEKLCR